MAENFKIEEYPFKTYPHLTLAIASYGSVLDEAVQSIFSLFGAFVRFRLYEHVSLDIIASCNLPGNRESLVQRAIDRKSSHLLFVDGDMSFLSEAYLWLHSRELPSVAVAYPKRCFPLAATCWDMNGNPVIVKEEDQGLLEVQYSGFGLSLFDMKCIEKMPMPRFSFLWNDKKKEHTTEDFLFFHNLKNSAGIKHYVDLDASKLVGHNGHHTYQFVPLKGMSPVERN